MTHGLELFDEPPCATPLDPDEAAGLIPTWIATRGDLNSEEQANIAKAVTWALTLHGPWTLQNLLSEDAMRGLHRRMFGDVWRWAGEYRRREASIGVRPFDIPVQLRDLLADVVVQASGAAALPWPPDEIAIRFHHRLVVIHPFPNGNGRHARLAADLLVRSLGGRIFSWGRENLDAKGGARARYLEALRLADDHQDFGPLIRLARS